MAVIYDVLRKLTINELARVTEDAFEHGYPPHRLEEYLATRRGRRLLLALRVRRALRHGSRVLLGRGWSW